jgi:hypothetical protein
MTSKSIIFAWIGGANGAHVRPPFVIDPTAGALEATGEFRLEARKALIREVRRIKLPASWRFKAVARLSASLAIWLATFLIRATYDIAISYDRCSVLDYGPAAQGAEGIGPNATAQNTGDALDHAPSGRTTAPSCSNSTASKGPVDLRLQDCLAPIQSTARPLLTACKSIGAPPFEQARQARRRITESPSCCPLGR